MRLFEHQGKYLEKNFSEILPGEVILICGYPRIGKTAFGLFLLQEWLTEPDKRGLAWICSGESETEMKQRMLCAQTSTDYSRYKTGHTSYLERRCYERAEHNFFRRHAIFIRDVREPYPAMKRIFKEILDTHDLSLMIADDIQDHTNDFISLKDIIHDFRIYAVKHEMTVIVMMNIIPDTPESVLKPGPANLFQECEPYCSRIFCLYEPYADCSTDEGFEENHLILKTLKNDSGSRKSVRLAYDRFLFREIESERLNRIDFLSS